MKKETTRAISFEEAELEFRKVVGRPIKRIWRSVGTWLWIDFGEMHSRQVKKAKTGDVFQSEQWDYTLEFEGAWLFKQGRKIIIEPQSLFETGDYYEAGVLLEKQIEGLHLESLIDVSFDYELESISFLFDGQKSIVATVDDVGLVNLHSRVDSKVVFFDAKRGRYSIEKSRLL